MNKKNNKNQGATSIVLTLFIMSAMIFVAVTANEIVVNGIKMSRINIDSTKAFFAAEAGAERVLWEYRKGGMFVSEASWTSGCCIKTPGSDQQEKITTCAETSPCKTKPSTNFDLSDGLVFFYDFKRVVDGGTGFETLTFTSYGNFDNKTQRAVEVSFVK